MSKLLGRKQKKNHSSSSYLGSYRNRARVFNDAKSNMEREVAENRQSMTGGGLPDWSASRSLVACLALVLFALLVSLDSFAGTIQGQFQNSGGGGLPNGTLTFSLTQPAVVSGTASVVPSPFSCYTDGSGNTVGEPNPLLAPVLSSNLAAGTLASGTYYVKISYQDSTGVTAVSPEAILNLPSAGTLIVTAPLKQPASSNGYQVFIGTSSGTETLQGTITGVPGAWGNYSQASALVAGSAMPPANTTQCKLRFNDELQPSFTCYNTSLSNQSGTSIPGYPQYWYLYGGSNGTVNVSTGTPQSTICQGSGVVYPQAIVSTPAANATQSISGNLSLSGFQLLNASRVDGIFYVDGVIYTTVHAAITAACAVGGGTVIVPPGTYAENTVLSGAAGTLCSQLHILFSGSGRPDVGSGCPSTVTTTITSGYLFDLTGLADVWLSDFCIKNLGAGGGGVIQFSSTQTSGAARFYVYGPFANPVQFKSSSAASASTIWNDVRDFHCSGLAANAVGVKFDSTDAVAKVINNNTVWNDHCTGGTGGKGLWFTNSNNAQVINENTINCSECSALNGVAIQFDQGATADTILDATNAEGSTTCFQKATGNTVTIKGGNFSACTTAVSDSQPAFTNDFETARVQAVVPNSGTTPIGGRYVDSVGIGGGRPTSLAIDGFVGLNGVSGYCFSVSATCNWEVQTSALVAHTDNATDIGLTGAKRPRHIYQAGKILEYNSITTVGNGVSATYGQDDKTGQSASIGSTVLITGTATSGGHYSACYQLATTTSDASGASVTLTVGWTSDSVARTNVSGSVALAATANGTALCVPLHADNSVNITYLTTVTGVPAAGRYAAHIWAMKQ